MGLLLLNDANIITMKGSYYSLETRSYKDPTTDVDIVRLTDNKANYDRPYFTTTQFSDDGKYTLFVSDFTHTSVVKNIDAPAVGKIGFGELFLLDLKTGKALQVTQGEAIKMGHGAHAMISHNGKSAYYYSNERLCEVNLETLVATELMRIPFSYNFHSLSISHDDRYIAFSVVEEVPLITATFADPLSEAAPGARERFFKEPSSLVIRYDLQRHIPETVYGGHYRITHVSMKPDNADDLLFCHDGPWHLVQRMWTVNAATDEVSPLFVQQYNLEGVVHEFFTVNGRVGAQYSYRYRPDMPFFRFADLYIDFDGKNQERYYYPFHRPLHVSTNHACNLAVGDTACLSKKMSDWKRYVSLISYDKESHAAIPGILCEHNTSGRKYAHVHPVFTPDDQNVVFSSDCEGKLNIYLAHIDKCKVIY